MIELVLALTDSRYVFRVVAETSGSSLSKLYPSLKSSSESHKSSGPRRSNMHLHVSK